MKINQVQWYFYKENKTFWLFDTSDIVWFIPYSLFKPKKPLKINFLEKINKKGLLSEDIK